MRNSDQTQTKDFILKGNILYAKSPQEIVTVDGGYLLCVDGKSVGVYDHIPPIYEDMPVTDYGDCLIIPGLNDLHVHAPQFLFRGLGMDCELLEWLERYAFPEEARYSDPTYANDGYNMFVDALKKSPTTRASVFATAHTDATLVLMKLLEESGLKTYVGRVNMDRNSSPLLQEESADFSITETERWIHESLARFENTRPILTPRFIPTCSDEVMEGLGALQKTYGLPLQSHLSENLGEIAWVKELCPWSEFYGDAYDHF